MYVVCEWQVGDIQYVSSHDILYGTLVYDQRVKYIVLYLYNRVWTAGPWTVGPQPCPCLCPCRVLYIMTHITAHTTLEL